MSGFTCEQDALVSVDKGVRCNLFERILRNPGNTGSISFSQDSRYHFACNLFSFEFCWVVGLVALDVNPPPARKRNNQDISSANTWVTIMEHSLNFPRIFRCFFNIDDNK